MGALFKLVAFDGSTNPPVSPPVLSTGVWVREWPPTFVAVVHLVMPLVPFMDKFASFTILSKLIKS